jgi:hypothetical protein
MITAEQPIDPAHLASGTWEIEIADKRVAAIASLKPLYDAENKKVKV